ncbi:hypothetical protein NMY22_g2571 [Coprinellus aureogranulatus]|nr:hypothetical protein NMY22_g2571 [Coprinellus aureogranulatus]
MSSKPAFWLRCEKKEFERRSALTPTTAKSLIDAGFEIFVEKDEQRIFDDSEFEAVGCKLVENNSWPSAPTDIPIIGLKELPASADPLPHTHIQFAHCFKGQAGWSEVLARFYKGKGTLYDLEFLNDDHGRRVAAFGFHAGFAGAAAGALALAARKQGKELGLLTPYPNETAMVEDVKSALGGSGKGVKALVIGALGRCGRGAVDLFRKIGLDEWVFPWQASWRWPFSEILDVDIFVNCIYLSSPIPHFVTRETVVAAGMDRRLRVVVDVSCDTTNPYNPIPIYSINTTFDKPTVAVDVGNEVPSLDVISIDHLPTLLPREASEQFSHDLLPSLLKFPNRSSERVWTDAEKLFKEKLSEAVQAEGLAYSTATPVLSLPFPRRRRHSLVLVASISMDILSLSSPIPQISISLAPPEDIPAEPYSPFTNTSFTLPQNEDAFRPVHLTPPPSHTSFRRRQFSSLGSSKESPEERPKQTGRGLDRARFEALLNACKEKPLPPKKDATDLRREVALKAHQSKQAGRRALFLSKVLAPPSPAAAVTPKTPPESPAIFHYSLPSPGLVSPIAHYESLQEQDGISQPWVEQVDFKLLSKPKPRLAPLAKTRQPLPSLEQISARLNGQRAARNQQASRNDSMQSVPPVATEPTPRLVVGRLRMPVRNSTMPTIMVSEFNNEDTEPEFDPTLPPKSPLLTTPSDLQITTMPVPRTQSASPTKLTQANLMALNSRESRSSAMLSTLRRRTQSNNLHQPTPRPTAKSEETDPCKAFRRHSAPPDSMDSASAPASSTPSSDYLEHFRRLAYKSLPFFGYSQQSLSLRFCTNVSAGSRAPSLLLMIGYPSYPLPVVACGFYCPFLEEKVPRLA